MNDNLFGMSWLLFALVILISCVLWADFVLHMMVNHKDKCKIETLVNK